MPEMNPKSKRITTNNQQKSHRVSSDGSRDTDTNPSMKDKMDQKCSNKNTVEKEGQQSINQPILFISDNTESRHTNIYTDGNIGFLQTNTEQSFFRPGLSKKTQDGKPENHYRFTKHTFFVQNVMANCVYLQKVLTTCDILCLQEHWMMSFEKHELGTDHLTCMVFCFVQNFFFGQHKS